jgi:hypothetical protein
VALRAIDTLKIALAPFLPFTCERLHHMLGYDGQLVGEFEVREIRETERTHLALLYKPESVLLRWQPSQLPPGQSCATSPLCSPNWTKKSPKKSGRSWANRWKGEG